MTREEQDFIGSMNMCDEISNEAYRKIMCHCEEQEPCNDVVSRNAIIQTLNNMDRYVANELKLCDTNNKFPQNEVFVVDDVYEQIVEQLPSVTPTQSWIPATERLPEKSGDYLVWLEPYQEKPFISIEEIDCDGIMKEWNHIHPWEIKAWMPLPQPYKAESEE